jgi:hypothetical protein
VAPDSNGPQGVPERGRDDTLVLPVPLARWQTELMSTEPLSVDAPISPVDLVNEIDRWGQLQAAHGDAARLANLEPDNMGLGAAAVELEEQHTVLRYRWGRALLDLFEADAEATEEQRKAVYDVIDGWAFGLWHAAWHAAVSGAADGGGLEEWKRLEVDSQRQVWEPAVRALIKRAA